MYQALSSALYMDCLVKRTTAMHRVSPYHYHPLCLIEETREEEVR